MGNNNSLSFLLGAALLCSSAAALATATVDYRHEYRLRDRTHYDKLGLSTTLPDNMFLGVETKFKTGGADPKDKYYNDTVLNVVEVTFLKSYYWGNWTVSPFIQPEFNSSRTEWKFGVAPWYKFNDRWSLGGLYRLELTDYAHDDQCRTGGIDYCDTGRHRTANRFDLYLRNKSDRLTTTYKLVYKHADAKLFANKHDDYEQELQFDYALGNDRVWVPYVTFGDIGRSATSSERQLRLRTGILYIYR